MTLLVIASILSVLSFLALLPSCLAGAQTAPSKPTLAASSRTVQRYRRGTVVIGV